MPLIVMGVLAAVGAVTGGVSAAQEYCKQEAQASQVLAQTQQFVQQSNALFKNLQALDNEVKGQINTVKEQEFIAVNTLQSMKQDYKATMKKMQIGVAIFIIIIFMLLLGKKLKIY